MGLVADHEFERRVDLMRGGRALMALDEHRAGAVLDHDQRAREHRGRLVAARRRTRAGSADRRRTPAATWITTPSLISAVLSATAASSVAHLGEMLAHQRIAGGERLRQRPDGQAGLSAAEVRQLGAKRRRRTPAAGLEVGQHAPASLARALAAASAAPRAAWRRASARAGRCISTPRRAGAAARAPRSRGNATWRSGPTAPGSFGRAAGLGASAARPPSSSGVRPSAFITPRARHGTARSRWPRARARAPCRRCAPSGRATSRAPRRARCS